MAADPPAPIDLWECNRASLDLFMAMGMQWRIGPNGPVGLDYCALPVVERGLGTELTRERFADLRLMESAVLEHFRRSRKD